jgi:hypothetical protein
MARSHREHVSALACAFTDCPDPEQIPPEDAADLTAAFGAAGWDEASVREREENQNQKRRTA